jgi:hypothetical protein
MHGGKSLQVAGDENRLLNLQVDRIVAKQIDRPKIGPKTVDDFGPQVASIILALSHQ